MLTCIGPEALEVFDGLDFGNETGRTKISVVLRKLEAFCIGGSNERYEQYKFKKRYQEVDESIDSYVACLRSLAKTCNYGELKDSLIRDRLVIGIRNNSVRKILLQDSKRSLKSCIRQVSQPRRFESAFTVRR